MTEQKPCPAEGVSIDILKSEIGVTNFQLDTRVEEVDLPELASCFDNTEDYIEKLQLSPGQQTDVKTKAFLYGIQAGIKIALIYWRNRNPVEATFRALLLILLSLFKGDVAVRVCKYLSDKNTALHFCQERVLLNAKLSSYRDYLKYRYSLKGATTTSQWPPVVTTQVFKLAMIQRENIQRGRVDDDYIRLSITGKVDDILLYKTPVEIENIFTECGNRRKFVLIEGAPGSGKSTLALHICQQWAENKLFQEYDVVVLVKLRDPEIGKAKTVADLLPRVNKAMAVETEVAMISMFGEGVLWVLDGWDELPSGLPPDSIISKLIQPHHSHESPLLKSSVVVFSRPMYSGDLHSLVSSRVEVLGFTPNELEQYFKECLKGDSGAVQTLLERIRENPVVEGSCYLPLNAAIVAHVFLSSDHSLPTSNHRIFTSVVQNSLKRYFQDKLRKTIPIEDITSPNSLPLETQVPFSHLCQLAFYGTQNNKVTFSNSDLTSLGISKDISELGLLHSVPSFVSDGFQVYFCFLHLSIQELLAAIHISHMSPKQQIYVFQDLFGTPQFNAVFQFYAGITKLRTSRPWLSLLPRFLCPVPTSVFDLVRNIIVRKQSNKSLLVSLFHCLYEADDPSLYVLVADLLDHFLYLAGTTLIPLDCLSVGYFLSVVCTTVCDGFRAYLYGCSIGDQGCKFFVRGLLKCLNTRSKSTTLLDLYLWDNNIHEEGIHHIAQLLKNTNVVRELILSSNVIGDSGLKSLCDALSTNTTLERLNVDRCKLIISEENGSFLFQLLSTNTSLSHLSLSGNTVTDCHHIAAGLSKNKTLKTLCFSHCGLTDSSVKDLSMGLNNYIEELNIGWNDAITMNGVKNLARSLTTCSMLKRLRISEHLESSINTVFSEVNEERWRNGLCEILVTVW